MNDFLSQLNVIDIRSRLPRAKWSIGTRSATTSETWHYNGPAVPSERQRGEGLIQQLIADAQWQMRPGWGGTVDGADGLMYHLIFASDGTIYQARDIDALLWHCAHADGNSRGLAFHFPIGLGQQPSAAQLISAFRASDLLRRRFAIPLNRTIGHLEWKHATACPGPNIMQHLVAYRAGVEPRVTKTPTPAGLKRFLLTCADKANVRQGPGTNFPIAGTLKSGTVVYVDVVKSGWVHMAKVEHEQADLGFISETLGAWL